MTGLRTSYTRSLLIISLILFSGSLFAQETSNQEDITVGVFKLSPPEKYVVAREAKTMKKRIIKKSSYIKGNPPGLVPMKIVILDEIEYRYTPVEGKVSLVSQDFELVELDGRKAVLAKAHIQSDGPLMEEPIPAVEALLPFEPSMLKNAPEEKKEAGKPSAKRLVASLFFKIESNKISDTEWEINLPTVLEAASNFGDVLGIVVKKISELIDPEKTAVVFLKSSIGKAKLGPDGLLIESLNSRLRRKCGIENGDLVKTVNGKALTKIGDVVALFSGFSGKAQTLTVGISRKKEELTYTYYLK